MENNDRIVKELATPDVVHKAYVPGEVLSGIQNYDHQEGNLLIRQHTEETLYEYWERFNKLCSTCSHHQISEQLLIQYFYEGLSMMDISMIDAASGGALMDKTPPATRYLISNMATNTQQFGIREPSQSRMCNSNQRLKNQLTELTSLVRQLAVGQHQPAMAAKVCGRCTSMEYPTDMCPTLQEIDMGSNHIRPSHLISKSMEDNHFGQDRFKGHMRLKQSNLP
ncbi:hypothetical protein CR513_24872, partial [Mucuna pruriens]